MNRVPTVASISFALIVPPLVVPTAALAAERAPTFTKDVAPIFYASCVECLRPTIFAPKSLMTYDVVPAGRTTAGAGQP